MGYHHHDFSLLKHVPSTAGVKKRNQSDTILWLMIILLQCQQAISNQKIKIKMLARLAQLARSLATNQKVPGSISSLVEG